MSISIATMKLMTRQLIVVTGRMRMNLPEVPLIAISGASARIVVACPASAGSAYLRTVLRAVCPNVSCSTKMPSCIPSIIRMNTSTSRPRASTIPMRTISLSVYPSAQMTPIAPRKESGIDRPAISASRQESMMNSTTNTHSIACQPLLKTRSRASQMRDD